MIRISKLKALIALALAAGGLAFAAPAAAQATRTWVSGVGDDVNPCSRTAPCKTFAGAISKTAAGGEINCLDPGGFGAVTITKSMTINCVYTEGGVLAGGNGITINAGPTDVVYLRGLDIFGVSPPSNGVRFLAGGALFIEDSVIRRFNAANSFGVSFAPSGNSLLFINNTVIADNGNGATGGGILIQPGTAGVARVVLSNVRVLNNANQQLRIDTTSNTTAGTRVNIQDSQFIGGTNAISVLVPAGTAGNQNVVVAVEESLVGFATSAGIRADGTNARVRAANSTLSANNVAVQIVNSARIDTYANNRLIGNTNPSTFSQPPLTEE